MVLVMSRHSFDPAIARQVGINAAVIYQNMLWWCEKNFANGRNVHDGYCWTYNSRKAWTALFDYLSEAQIRTAIDKLLASGLVIKGDYNQNRYDRTCWYAPVISADWVGKMAGDIDPVHWSKIANGLAENDQPIPDRKPDIKPDSLIVDLAIDEPPADDQLKVSDVVEYWNEVAERIGKPKVQRLSDGRKQVIRARIKQNTVDDFLLVFKNIEASDFLRNWKAMGFDWVFKAGNFQKILEGNYND